MAKPNYKFDKRQRDLAKKKQQDEKLLRKRAKTAGAGADETSVAQPDAPSSGAAANAKS
jgi:hypothetical protein